MVTYTRSTGNNLREGKSMPSVQYLNGRIGDIWMVESSLTEEDSHGRKQKMQYFAKKDVIWEWREFSNSGVVVPFDKGRNMYQNWHYFHLYGITPYRTIAINNGLSFSEIKELAKTEPFLFPLNDELLPDCVQSNLASYHIRPSQEAVENSLCWVVEREGVDIIWIDPSCGNAIRKRITYWGMGETQKIEVHNRRFKEIEPGLYLPFEQEVTHYIGREMGLAESLLGKPLYRFVYTVDDMQIGTLDEAAQEKLVLRPAIGTSVFDVRTENYYTIWDENTDPLRVPSPRASNRIVS